MKKTLNTVLLSLLDSVSVQEVYVSQIGTIHESRFFNKITLNNSKNDHFKRAKGLLVFCAGL